MPAIDAGICGWFPVKGKLIQKGKQIVCSLYVSSHLLLAFLRALKEALEKVHANPLILHIGG